MRAPGGIQAIGWGESFPGPGVPPGAISQTSTPAAAAHPASGPAVPARAHTRLPVRPPAAPESRTSGPRPGRSGDSRTPGPSPAAPLESRPPPRSVRLESWLSGPGSGRSGESRTPGPRPGESTRPPARPLRRKAAHPASGPAGPARAVHPASGPAGPARAVHPASGPAGPARAVHPAPVQVLRGKAAPRPGPLPLESWISGLGSGRCAGKPHSRSPARPFRREHTPARPPGRCARKPHTRLQSSRSVGNPHTRPESSRSVGNPPRPLRRRAAHPPPDPTVPPEW
ncbi:hypothetical protein M2161_003072 [Streptomyces sp. SAI-133]|nr:hypothetical protein [Streptomyces sp. SAI-133]